jgi:hypothetical protein
MRAYNSHRPMAKDVYPIYISKQYTEVSKAEKGILDAMYEKAKEIPVARKEWFNIKYKDYALDVLDQASKYFK